MSCWPANIVGIFFIALIVFDIVNKYWVNLGYHAGIGILLTGLFWALCSFIGEYISAAILVVPLVFVVGFLVSNAMQLPPVQPVNNQCNEEVDCNKALKAVLVKKTPSEIPTCIPGPHGPVPPGPVPPLPPGPLPAPKPDSCSNSLKVISHIQSSR